MKNFSQPEWKLKMKTFILAIGLVCIGILVPQPDIWGEEKSAEDLLEGIDAFQAMELANDWKWSRKDIKSSVYPQAIVFKLPNGRIKRISLPADQMLVAVAPYINNTHG